VSFAAPLWLVVAGVVAAGLIVAHLISTSVPQRDPFPTARFVPEGAPLTVLRTRRLTDIALLLLRLLAVVLLGLALAGARVAKGGPPRVLLADLSRAVADSGEVRDSVTALGDDAIVVSIDKDARLSAALVAAHRILADATKNRGRTELVIVSPLVREEIDSATAPLLQLWEGPVRLVRVASAFNAAARLTIRASGDDPLAAALTESRPSSGESRIVRERPTAADSLWAQDSVGALVIWPADLATSGLRRRVAPDTSLGIAAGAHVVIGTFTRTHEPAAGAVVARWLDGAPAATEVAVGRGCVREVAVPVDAVGDVALRDNFRGLARRMSEPCGGARDLARVELGELLRDRPTSAVGIEPLLADGRPSRIALSLALLVIVILAAEQLLRRRERVA
jgi:hypothetical protein